jgi:hypothetical protein
MTGTLNMGPTTQNKIINLLAGTDLLDCVNKSQMDTSDNLRLLKAGDTMTGTLNMGLTTQNKIINLLAGTDLLDCVNKKQMDDADNLRLLKSGDTMTGTLNMGPTTQNKIINLLAGTNSLDCVNKSQMDTADNLRLLKSGDTMTGTLNMGPTTQNKIINLLAGTNSLDGVNKSQMDTADNLRLSKSGGVMTGDLDMSGNSIININNLASKTGTYLNLLLGTANIIQLTPAQVIFKAPILIFGIADGGTGIYMAGTKIDNLSTGTNPQDAVNKEQMDNADNLRLKLDGTSIMVGQLNMNANTLNNCPNLNAGTTMNFKIGGAIVMNTLATGLVLSQPINMNSKLINSLGDGSLSTDAVNKGQMDTADLLKMDKANGVGTGQMTLTNNGASLKLSNSIGSGNLILESLSNAQISFQNITTHNLVATISASTTSDNLYFYNSSSYTPSLMLNSTSVNCLLPTNITGSLTMATGVIDMSGNDITKVSNINSNGLNALNLQHNSIAKIKVDSSGLTMQNNGNINMNNGTISNTTLTTPKITAPIQTTTSSSYSTINSNYLNIGFTSSKSYNIYTTIAPSTAVRLLKSSGTPSVYNKLTVAPGVWIITAMFNPFCISGTPNSSRIKMFVSNVSSATVWTEFQASSCHQMLNGNYDSSDSARMVNTFVIDLSASSTDLYLWGVIDYSGDTAWGYDYAEVKATRIA